MSNELRTIEKESLLLTSSIERENSVLHRILVVFALTELTQQNDNQDKPWRNNINLGKRRNAYSFDHDLHCMIDYVGQFGDYTAAIIDCGKSGFYRTELKKEDGTTLHFFYSFNPASKYLKPYLRKNNDYDNPQYGFFEYTIGKDNCITSVVFVVPTETGDCDNRVDLTDALKIIRNELNIENVSTLLERLKVQQKSEINSNEYSEDVLKIDKSNEEDTTNV